MLIFNAHNRTVTGRESSLDKVTTQNYIRIGQVISINDLSGVGRIKVRIQGSKVNGGDDGVDNNDLPWCHPLLPKHLQITPKVNEAVFVFILNDKSKNIDRLYMGPIISQEQNLSQDPFFFSALAGFSFSPTQPQQNVKNIPQIRGVFPNKQDITIQGRNNTDIIQKNNEIVIRAGKFQPNTQVGNNPFSFEFNSKTQAYIQLKNNITIPNEENGTVANIVANKINLITHKNGSPRFNVLNQTDNVDLISDEELNNILTTAHQVPFGDVLLEYLKLLKEALFAHVHNGSGNPPTDLTISGNKQSLAIFKSKADELERNMLSKNIRIN